MKKLRIGTPVAIKNLQVIPIEMISLHCARTGRQLVALAAKEPVAIVIRSRGKVRVLDLEGHGASLDELLRDVSGLQDLLHGPVPDL